MEDLRQAQIGARRNPYHGSCPSNYKDLNAYFLLALLLVFVCIALGRSTLIAEGKTSYFWDAQVYAKAIAASRTGQDPYKSATSSSLPFVYSPLVLKCANLFGAIFPGAVGWYLYLAATWLSLLAIPWLVTWGYIRRRWFTPAIAIAIFGLQPKFFAALALLTGNISSVLYCVTLLAGVRGLRRSRWGIFLLVVTAAALIKPQFLCFLMFPILADRPSISLKKVVLSGGIVIITNPLQRFLMPGLYSEFRESLYREFVLERDMGFGIAYLVARHVPSIGFLGAWLVHFVVVGSMMIVLYLFWKRGQSVETEHLLLPVMIVVAVVLNPRIEGYDACVAVVPAAFILFDSIGRYADRYAAAAALWMSLFVLVDAHDAMTGVLFFLLSSVAVVILRLGINSGAFGDHQAIGEHTIRPSM